MRVTVCELRNDPADLARDWDALVSHANAAGSDLVLLPEMPFFPWVAHTNQVDPGTWRAAVETHDAWMVRLEALAPAVVCGSRPVLKAGQPVNEGFVWEPETGYRPVHAKYYLPDEPGFWEASWYRRGSCDFAPAGAGNARVGFMICTEMWFTEHARAYARQGVQLLLSPRGTPLGSADKWVAGGRAAAVVSGAFCLSSNRGGTDKQGMAWAGTGWIIEPEEGEVLGLTSPAEPFMTLDIDLAAADAAKRTYPRYVLE
jgi:predicted amidohydrolase